MVNLGIGTYPERRAIIRGEDIAWSFEGQDTTYHQVNARVNQLARALQEAGVRHGDRVAYVGFNHPALLETFFATTLLGAICVLVNPRLAAGEVRYILGDSDPKVIIFGEEQRANSQQLSQELSDFLIWLDVDRGDFEKFLHTGKPCRLETEVDENDVAMLMYTSGTTGKPKGVMLTHRALFYQYVNCLIGEDLRQTEVNLIAAPLFHIAGLNMVTMPSFMMGARIIIQRKFCAADVLETIQREKVTSAFMVPAMLDALTHEEGFEAADLSTLRNLMVGGSPLPARMFRTWENKGIVISQGFGMTETAPGVRMLDPRDGITKAGTAGRPHFFTESRVVNTMGQDAAVGEPGEIIVRGPNVMVGYWNNPAATSMAIQDGWYYTGDIGSIDEENYLRIHDRIKDMYISGGENVYPAEIENALLDIEGVQEAAVIGVPDERWGETGIGFVVLDPGYELDSEQIRTALRQSLAGYKLPKEIRAVDEMPRTTTGKIRKNILRSHY